MRLDSHQHFWRYNPAEYDWIDKGMGAIRRDFLPADLAATIGAAGVQQVISVQARQSVAETRWLLDLASSHDFICGVVGWLPLADPAVERQIEEFSVHCKLRSLRHVVQGEPDPHFL